METTIYYEVVVQAQRRVEYIPACIKDRLDEIQYLAGLCDARRGDVVELVECVAPMREQVGPITGRQLVAQRDEAQRTTIRRWVVIRARDMQLREM